MQDFIHACKKAVDTTTCQNLIDLFETHSHLHVEGRVGGLNATKSDWKKDTEIAITPDFFQDAIWKESLISFMHSLSTELEHYKKEYTFYTEDHEVCGLDGLAQWRMYPTFNFQRYLPGEGYFAWHCEAPNPQMKYVSRMLAWMVYLNDVPDGGTEFKFQKFKSEAESGTILIWPPYWTHMHRGIVSKTTNKYILTGWCNFLTESGEYFK